MYDNIFNMTKKFEVAMLFLLLILTGFFATYKLTESPSVWYDEGIYFQTAANLAQGKGMNFQFAPGHLEDMMSRFTVSYPFIYPLAAAFKVFGVNILVGRSLMVFFIFALSMCGYFLIRRRFGVNFALGALALIVTFPPLYGNGKSILGEVPGLIFLTLSLLSFQYSIKFRDQSNLGIILAGFFAGLCASTKPVFLVFLPGFAFVALFHLYRGLLSKKQVVLGGIFSLLPVLVWLFIQFKSADSLNTIFTFYANPYAVKSILGVIKENLINFITEAGPLYLLLMLIVWTSAIFIRRLKKISISGEETIAFSFCILISLAYLRIQGWHRYIFPAQVVALLYLAPSLSICAEWIAEKIKKQKISAYFQKFGTLTIVAVLLLWGIYGVMFNSCVASAYKVDKTAFWENYFKSSSVGTSFFFYNAPEVAIFSLSDNYYQYLPLPTAGGLFGEEWLKVIENGNVDKIIVRTDIFGSQKDWFLKHYRLEREAYKYTILIKK